MKKNGNKFGKKMMAVLLAMAMLITMIPVAAFAETKTNITVYMTLFDQGEFCKDKNSQVMWQRPVTVTDINGDGKYSADEALVAAHAQYYVDGVAGYVTEYNEIYQSTTVLELWGKDASFSGYYRNDNFTGPVDKEYLISGDKITAALFYDTISYSDRYSFFNKSSVTVDKGEEFGLKLSSWGYDEYWNTVEKPVGTAPIGVYDMTDGSYSVPSILRGENLFGDFYIPKPSTGSDGTVKMSFTEIGKYYVTAEYNSSYYSTYDDMLGTVPNYLIPPVCVVTVIDDQIKAVTNSINAIGTVTEESGEAIKTAREAYNALSAEQKELVSNFKLLTDSEIAYEKLLTDRADKEKADAVTAMISAIGNVTVDSGKAIADARAAYDSLTESQKVMVSNLDTLTEAEVAYAKIVADKEDREKADAVSALISSIGKVSENSGKAITGARTAYDALSDTQKALVENYDKLTAAEKEFFSLNIKRIYDTTVSYLLKAVPTPTIGSEWAIISLARNNAKVPDNYYSEYYSSVEEYVKENIKAGDKLHNSRATESSRVIVALTAIGKDPRNVGGHNLLKGIADFDYVKKQGINSVAWALIAFDTCDFEIPVLKDVETQVTREKLIDYMLSNEIETGGWALAGTVVDPDVTGMVIQALAPYYKTDSRVKKAVDAAVVALSEMQRDDGGYATGGVQSAESCAQVITALASIGIDANSDPRFIKNGFSVYEALMKYYVDGGGFRLASEDKPNNLATCQGLYSMAAYNRFKEGKTNLYDMSDVKVDLNNSTTQQTPETGDSVNLAPWLALLAVMVAGTAFAAYKRKED